MEKARWLEARQSELLPVDYFHVVFTMDHLINPLAQWNALAIYNLLFAAASATLKAFGIKYLGGETGFVAVLHTWGQDLGCHIHLHCIVAGGALSKDRSKWRSTPKDFLFPIVELSAHFRDLFCQRLRDLYNKGALSFGGSCTEVSIRERFEDMVSQMKAKKWEVYAKEPFGGPERVLDYLGRYVHRVAISNNRILSTEDGRVRFHYRDNRSGGELKEMSLPAEQFIDRFLQHVLPPGFVRIRYYGFLQGSHRHEKLNRIRELLGCTGEIAGSIPETMAALFARLTGRDLTVCPVCGSGRMIPIFELARQGHGKVMAEEDLITLCQAA